jgi:predicted nucleotidyltransferase
MRLSDKIVKTIKKSLYSSFGKVDIYLFGSRVDDTKKGGDIDIAVDTNLSRIEFRQKKAIFFANMLYMGYDIKIDLVQFNSASHLLKSEIKKQSIKL